MGNVLKAFLIVGITLSGLSLGTTLFYVFLYDIYEMLIVFDQAISILSIIIWILLIVFYLIWIYQVHVDFRRLAPCYKIKPGGALLRIMVPFYNLYGMWNVYSTMGDYFKKHSALKHIGIKIIQLTPIYYFLYWGTTLMDRLILKGMVVNDLFLLSYYVLDFILMISFFLIIKTVLKAFEIVEGDYETYQETVQNPLETTNE